ncbi:hypothetical protein VNO78_10999 [Psophocarpus tetragonolobus]|uniref:Uncharacterized protein n=1 Tax=Psophocarpus tetragonolobus TaxID=3891 RepID=A0AAN9SL09_PSOTE
MHLSLLSQLLTYILSLDYSLVLLGPSLSLYCSEIFCLLASKRKQCSLLPYKGQFKLSTRALCFNSVTIFFSCEKNLGCLVFYTLAM